MSSEDRTTKALRCMSEARYMKCTCANRWLWTHIFGWFIMFVLWIFSTKQKNSSVL